MDITNKQEVFKDQLREERQARLENKFFGSIVPKKNHKCYKYNISSGKLFELTDEDYYEPEAKILPQFKMYNGVDDGKGNKFATIREAQGRGKVKKDNRQRVVHTKKVKIEPNTYYFTALNETNAVNKIAKIFNL